MSEHTDPQAVKHIVTKDGSSTLYAPGFDEHYHSIHGAVQESLHVFIQMGLSALPDEGTVRIFEMGFGTGLNALLTYFHRGNRQVDYVGIEAFPIIWEQAKDLSYAKDMNDPDAEVVFQRMHEADWEQPVALTEGFTLTKLKTELNQVQAQEPFDLIYFDAFAPNTQPELWTDEVMNLMFQMLRPGGIWVTYSAKSSVRRALIQAGLEVEKLPGPPGKREMLRASKPLQ
ncbi:tRNA (5-methylaminomethyl-2-thiouridine)(34)-methyltransferase MnmD [Pontibacter sp. G13]|uniref:tRNA (5-methylaminomethyl-2-thiouridine)(34)-methyltransferase MnmD n=1 Tax=Pontibacter sp. G13 TaxID=3074898 RepID=UPI00288ADCBD|nr:tRNA (5-methylaminomethyl-2-thiouridine)(34)-methyltransferase MnmD [Pontibacter sp. G13]WNJ20189.1 tRNA (5-methylaminomethyl-2-thiouridine)(34)-methyltransferase MnmD [Pontibacter sp. G13]